MALRRLGVRLEASARRPAPARIVIPSHVGGRAKDNLGEGGRGGAAAFGLAGSQGFLSTERFLSAPRAEPPHSAPQGKQRRQRHGRDRSGRDKVVPSSLAVGDEPYVSKRGTDRVENPAASGHNRVDVNDYEESFGRYPGSPTHNRTLAGPELASHVPGPDADFIARQQAEHTASDAADARDDQLWYDSRKHLRIQRRMVEECGGLEGAVATTLSAAHTTSVTSRRSLIQGRPLDRRILEEIHKDMHGLRSEGNLKRNVGWEHWVAKSDQNLPVRWASRAAQETFGFGGKATLMRAATTAAEFPVTPLPEVAFFGRANSGRSSLINALLNQYACRFGNLPGTTQRAEFLRVANSIVLVDLPGYGYHNPLHTDPLMVQQGQRVMEGYINACCDEPKSADGSSNERARGGPPAPKRNIKRAFVCVQSATGPIDADLDVMRALDLRAIPFTVLLMKTDKVPIQLLARVADFTRSEIVSFSHCHELMMVNALRMAGIHRLQNLLGSLTRGGTTGVSLDANFDSIV